MGKDDPFHIVKLLFALNHVEFCALPRPLHVSWSYMYAYYRSFNVDMKKFNRIFNTSDEYLDRVYKRYDDLRVPLVTHRVWLTNPYMPNELKKIFSDPVL
jgi:hypothetical protein